MTLSSERFEAYTPEHFSLLIGFLVVAALVVWWGRRHAGTAAEVRARRGLAVLIAAVNLLNQTYQFWPGQFDRQSSIPLQLCDLAWMAAVVALWSGNRTAYALGYFWGLTLTVQGMLTPSLGQTFPDPRYFGFWALHFGTVWAIAYLAVGLRWRIDWRSWRIAMVVTACWALLVMTFNAVADTNYGYLNRKPSVSSVLDLLPAWPWYVPCLVVILGLVWGLLTLPWTRGRD